MQNASLFWTLRVQSRISSSEHLLVSWWEKCEKEEREVCWRLLWPKDMRTLDTARERKKISLWLTFFVEPMHIFSCAFCLRRESKLMFWEVLKPHRHCKNSAWIYDFCCQKKKDSLATISKWTQKFWANFEFVWLLRIYKREKRRLKHRFSRNEKPRDEIDDFKHHHRNSLNIQATR